MNKAHLLLSGDSIQGLGFRVQRMTYQHGNVLDVHDMPDGRDVTYLKQPMVLQVFKASFQAKLRCFHMPAPTCSSTTT